MPTGSGVPPARPPRRGGKSPGGEAAPGEAEAAEDVRRMREALAWAREAAAEGEAPVGAVVYQGARRVGGAGNRREALQDPTAHAEMLAITQAAGALGAWRLGGCALYVTLEPCAMCAGAIVLARLDRVVYGAADPKAGACGSILDITGHPSLNHAPRVRGGVLGAECGALLTRFFKARRAEAARAADGPAEGAAEEGP